MNAKYNTLQYFVLMGILIIAFRSLVLCLLVCLPGNVLFCVIRNKFYFQICVEM
jgi:hypothetical protein